MTDLEIGRDHHSIPNTGIKFSNSGKYITLPASGSASVAVPAGMKWAYIQTQPGATVLIDKSSISYSASASFQNGTFDVNPSVRRVESGDTLYFYAIDSAIVKISFYRR